MIEGLAGRLLEGDRRSLARAISLVEERGSEASKIISAIYPETGNAQVVGITGTPGAGKSTLVDRMVDGLRDEGFKMGIIAVDPSSPFTGGALLGDRVRMSERKADEEVFFRSMGTRGSVGGLSRATQDAVKVMDAYGMDIILIETVGAGHSDLNIVETADSCVVVLMPGTGDEIQALKAGILEIGDIFVVNKADLEGSEEMAREIRTMVEMGGNEMAGLPPGHKGLGRSEEAGQEGAEGWRPPVLMTVAESGEGVDGLIENVKEHLKYLEESGRLERRREEHRKEELMKILSDRLTAKIMRKAESDEKLEDLVKDVAVKKKIDPGSAAEKLISELDL